MKRSGYKGRSIVVVDSIERAVAAHSMQPESLVIVFARDWGEVDRGRAETRARGLESRILIHHHSAMACARVA